nr:hypothetical protein CFP56_02532 [Quercus suber]
MHESVDDAFARCRGLDGCNAYHRDRRQAQLCTARVLRWKQLLVRSRWIQVIVCRTRSARRAKLLIEEDEAQERKRVDAIITATAESYIDNKIRHPRFAGSGPKNKAALSARHSTNQPMPQSSAGLDYFDVSSLGAAPSSLSSNTFMPKGRATIRFDEAM